MATIILILILLTCGGVKGADTTGVTFTAGVSTTVLSADQDINLAGGFVGVGVRVKLFTVRKKIKDIKDRSKLGTTKYVPFSLRMNGGFYLNNRTTLGISGSDKVVMISLMNEVPIRLISRGKFALCVVPFLQGVKLISVSEVITTPINLIIGTGVNVSIGRVSAGMNIGFNTLGYKLPHVEKWTPYQMDRPVDSRMISFNLAYRIK